MRHLNATVSVSYCVGMEGAHIPDPLRLSVGELAASAGVSRRTVRYYVQRGLMPAPEGLGRGAHYTEEHLGRLVRIRDLQAAGVSLEDIAETLEAGAAPSGRDDGAPHAALASSPVARGARTPTRWLRAVAADGVELHVREGALPEAVVDLLVRLVAHHAAIASLPPEESP